MDHLTTAATIAGGAVCFCYLSKMEREAKRLRTDLPTQKRSYHLISGLQVGADRGALLGLDDARQQDPQEGAARLTTGGFAPLGFKCDDYIQSSDVDPSAEAAASIEGEKKWLHGPVNESVRDLIKKFGVRELPNEQHKVKFKAKDLANVDLCDVLVCFRSPTANSGAGTEQTANYAAFGEYTFVEQFKNGETAGGALQRQGLLASPGWPAEYIVQADKSDGINVVEFVKGKAYHVLESFAHATPLDAKKTAKKGKDVYQMKALTQSDLLAESRVWTPKVAARSVLCSTLRQQEEDDLSDEKDNDVAKEIVDFLRRNVPNTMSQPLKVGRKY